MRTDQSERYRLELGSNDPVIRSVAARQLARLSIGRTRPRSSARSSRWSHVPLADLFKEQGNHVRPRREGRFETGHEPMHASKSGRCVIIDPTLGRWWCRACRQAGDAARFVMDARGCSYPQATAWLERRYGRPAGPPNPQRSYVRRTEI